MSSSMLASPALLLFGIVVLLAGGKLALIWGSRLPRQGNWLVGLGLLILLITLGLEWSVLVSGGYAPQTWLWGWIWPRDEDGAINVGLLRDALGLAMATLATLVGASLLASPGMQAYGQRLGRFYAAVAFCVVGVALSWFALTPWLALFGLATTIFGGFIALGTFWDEPAEAELASRFGWERTWGFALAVLGLCVLAGGRPFLSLINPVGDSWTAQSVGANTDLFGAGLLALGVLVQMQPYPLLGWVMRDSKSPCSSRIVLSQVFSAWAAAAVLIRLEPQLREVGVFPAFGWIGLVSSMLAAIAGVFSQKWRITLSAWTSAGFSLAVAVLAFAGAAPAFCVFVGFGLGASALAGFGTALESGPETHKKIIIWAKVGAGLAAACGTGLIGFVSAGGGVRWLSHVWDQSALAVVSALALFLFAFVGWKAAWTSIFMRVGEDADGDASGAKMTWSFLLAPYLLIVLGLGAVWTGTATGGALPGSPDHLFQSLLAKFFPAAGEVTNDDANFASASGLYWGSLLVAMIASYWTAGRRQAFWPGVSRSLPRFSEFVRSGYGIDRLFGQLLHLIVWLGQSSVWLVDQKLWSVWIPKAVASGFERGAEYVASLDARIAWRLGGVLRRPVEAGSKLLQLIQNGDVQWYLLFAVGSGIAILAHFMRT